jgi:hypothetical protein
MSRNSVVLEQPAFEESFAGRSALPGTAALAHASEYVDLIRRLFHRPSAVAVVGSGAGTDSMTLCHALARELALSGRRVVVVAIAKLLQLNPITPPDEKSFMPDRLPNIWIWPAPLGQQIDFFKPRKSPGAGTWLDSLRDSFDAVLLACDGASMAAEVVGIADATVLAVEAGRTSKQQIQRDQRILQSRGARLAGCILIKRK